jgi:hypothetical protein
MNDLLPSSSTQFFECSLVDEKEMDDEERDVTTKASTTADRPTSIVATNIIKDEMLIAEVPLPAVDFLRDSRGDQYDTNRNADTAVSKHLPR